MNRIHRVRCTVGLTVAAALFGVAACSSSSSKAGSTTAGPSTTASSTSTTSPAVPTPFMIHQRIGTGARWELTTVAARRSGHTFSVAVDVLNTGTDAATFGAAQPGLFTLLDEYPSPAAPNPPDHSPSSKLAAVVIPANGTRRFEMSFSGVPTWEKHPILWFHGHHMPGTEDASVWFSGV